MYRRWTKSHSRDSGISLASPNPEEELNIIVKDPEQILGPLVPDFLTMDDPTNESWDVGPDQALDLKATFAQDYPVGNILLKLTAAIT